MPSRFKCPLCNLERPRLPSAENSPEDRVDERTLVTGLAPTDSPPLLSRSGQELTRARNDLQGWAGWRQGEESILA